MPVLMNTVKIVVSCIYKSEDDICMKSDLSHCSTCWFS